MNFSKNKMIQSTLIYFVGNVLSKAMIFFMLPLYTSRIPAEGMGLYDTNTTVITFFASVLFLDIGSTILRYSLAGKSDIEKNAAMTNGAMIFLMSTLLYCALLSVAGVLLDIQYYLWIVLYGLLYAANTVIGQCARAVEHNTDYAIAGIIQTFVLIVSNLILILGFDFDYSALLISFCVATTVSTLYLLMRSALHRHIAPSLFNKQQFADIFKFTLPLCVNSIAFWFLSSSGKVILRYMNGAEQVGYLSIAGKFTQIIYLVSSCIQLTWQEIAFSHDNSSKDTGTFYSKSFSLYFKVMMMGTVLIIPCIKIGLTLFPGFIDASYSESLDLIPAALFGTGLAIVSQFTGTIFSSIKKTNVIFISTLLGAVVSVSSNIVLILADFGAASVNYSFILGYIATIIMRIIILKKCMQFKVDYMNILAVTLLFILTSIVYITTNMMWSIVLLPGLLAFSVLFFKKELRSLLKK